LTSVLIPIAFQPPLFTAFWSETEIVHLYSVCLRSAETKPDYLYRDHLGSASAESYSASSEESQHFTSQNLQKRSSSTAKTKIDVHVGTLSMEFGDTLVQFNIFEVIKHPVEDTSPFCIDLINELIEEHMQADTGNIEIFHVAGNTDILDCLRSVIEEPDYDES
ncbi:hypothetical protein CR513_02397, partial [Mucuna pruriens]